MTLLQNIEQELVAAMKSKRQEVVSTLRMVKAALGNTRIEKKKEVLTDQEILEVIQKQVKLRRESFESFVKAGRQDLADKEAREIKILEHYLPSQLSDQEIKDIALKAIEATGAKSKQDAGRVMKELMPKVKGKADGKRVNETLMSLLP